MLYDIENQSTINVEDGIEIVREELLSAAMALPYKEKVQLLRFIEGGTANERGYDCMVQRHQNG